MKLFVNHCNCDGIIYSTSLNDSIKFERNNVDIVFLVLFVDVVFKVFQDNEVFLKQVCLLEHFKREKKRVCYLFLMVFLQKKD